MNPQDLIGPSSVLGNPAPFWFITFFKVLGFILHMIPKNIWYAGMILVAVFAAFGKGNSRLLAHRLSRSMPVIVAVGVNLGIVPLLFTQVGYYQFYYPAGVLMGWPWIGVILLLAVAYYGVYTYSLSIKRDPEQSSRFAVASAWISSLLFIVIGFLFANNFSLMVNVHDWIHIFNRTNVAGAPSGIALNAISRQWVQNVEISRYEDVTSLPVNTQRSPMIVFLLLFVAGLSTFVWMVSKIVSVEKVAVKN